MIHLYLKKCSHCKLKYFGRTKHNPFSYKGSGVHWTNHLKHHNAYPETLIVWSFLSQEDCTEFALTFSKKHNISESSMWANQKDEDGMPCGFGRGKGWKHDLSTKLKIGKANSTSLLGKKHAESTKQKMSESHRGHQRLTDEGRRRIIEKNKGRIVSDETKERIKTHHVGMKGKYHTAETKRKMSMAAKGRRFTPEHREKLRQARRRYLRLQEISY